MKRGIAWLLALLLCAAAQYGAQVRAYFVKTPFQPAFELRDAQRLAGELSMPLTVIEFDVLSVPGAAENGPERCYHCKRMGFTRIVEAASEGLSEAERQTMYRALALVSENLERIYTHKKTAGDRAARDEQ